MSEALRTYATLMDRLHRLIAAGNGESDEADAIRDDLIAKGVEVMDGDQLGWDWRLDI